MSGCEKCGNEGCFACCDSCNYDTHTCMGCGAFLPHVLGTVCLRCRNLTSPEVWVDQGVERHGSKSSGVRRV